MAGPKVNAKGKQGGSPSDSLRDGTVFLQAKWLKYFNF